MSANMDRFGVEILVVLLCFGTVLCQDPETMTIKEGSGPVEVNAGDTDIVFTCDINRDVQLILNNKILWFHQSIALGGDPVMLTEQSTLKDAASPNDYNINVDYSSEPGHIMATLTLKKVKVEQDGYFICQVVSMAGGPARLEEKIELLVRNNVEAIALVFDGEPAVTTVEPSEVQRVEGTYSVKCTASGFSPDATVSIFLAQELVSVQPTVTLDAEASETAMARRYVAETTAELSLDSSLSGNAVRCVGKATFSGAVPRTASFPLQIIALEPTVTCDKNISTVVGERYVKIRCVVDHSNVEVDRYVFEIGETGEFIEPGNMTADYHEVMVNKLNETATEVILDLYELESKHIDEYGGASYFYLDVFLKNGKRYRDKAVLYARENSGVSQKAAILSVFIAALTSLLLSL